MPDAIQRALSALWRFIFLTLGISGVAYIAWNAQVDPVPAFLVPSSWFLFCYMLFFPTSQPAAGLVYCFEQLDDSDIKAVILVFAALLSFHSLYQRSPAGMIYIVAFGIIDFGITQRDVYRAAMDSATGIGLLGGAPQPDTAAAPEADDSSDNNIATEHEASLASEPEEPAEQEPLDSADPSIGPLVLIAVPDGASAEEVVKPKSWARSAMKIIWSFLWFILKLGALTVVIHTLITVLLKSWALMPTPVDIAPLFKAEVTVQANKTQLPIPVPMAEFIPTGTFASPCQAAPTPIPVAKSIVTVTSTPMPTPMPAPTPSAVPEPAPEPAPVAIPDEAFELLSRMFDFPVPDPKPLLTWYFDLPPSSQYALIVASLLVLWCLSKPLLILAPHLIILAIDYLAAAAMLPLLFRYDFDPKQSIAITWAADCALTASIWYVAYWLWNLGALCRNNTTGLADVKSQFQDTASDFADVKSQFEDTASGFADIKGQFEDHVSSIADIRSQSEDNNSGLSDLRSQFRDHDAGLTGLGNRFEDFVAQSKLVWADTVKPIAAIKKVLHILVLSVISIGKRADALAKTVRHHATEIDALGKKVITKAELDQTMKILEQISGQVAGLETSKADAGILRVTQEELESLRSLVVSLQSEKANATDLKRVREELEKLRDSIDDLQNTKADATAVANITDKVKGLATDLTGIREAQDELNTDVGTLMRDRDGARKDIESLQKTSTQHADAISTLKAAAKMSKDALNGIKGREGNPKKAAGDPMSKLKQENAELRQENADLRRDFGKLEGIVTGMQGKMTAMEAREDKHDQDLNQLRDEVASETNQLRSEISSNKSEAMQADSALKVSVDTRFANLDKARKDLDKENKETFDSLADWANKQTKIVADNWNATSERMDGVDKNLVDISKRVDAADGRTSGVLQRVEALESRADGSIAELQVDDYIRSKVAEYMEEFMVSDRFRASLNEAQQLTKKQSQRERLRAQIHEAAEEFLHKREVQDKMYANFVEWQNANDNPLGDPAGVVPGGRASSPGVGPSNSAAPDNTVGNDGPLGDPPGVISGGRAALPGGMSSDNNTTPTIPEESTIPDDVDDHHGSRGVPLGEPPGAYLGGRSKSLGGSTSAGPSCDGGAGPRPSGEDDDGTLQLKRRERSKSCGPGILPDEQLRGPANCGEQDEDTDEEETDEEETDDDNEDDAHDGGDDDESDDDGPPGPPPGSGGSNGHNGTDGKDDDDQDGDNGGAPRPFTGHGITRGSAGLANSSYASDPTSGTGNFRSQSPAAGAAGHTNDTRQKPKKAKAFEDATPSQQNRRRKQWHKVLDKKAEGKQARKEEELARQEAQALNPPEVAQKQPRNRSNRKRGRHGKGNQQGGQQVNR
ncbi:hypothetical protein SLS64_013807 [Diaporthe eres]|uniref:Uncharacterized protein n=1 Tax=Diaporthe eres TaxID=83184 RepID=A0ABR1PIN8_DIAER